MNWLILVAIIVSVIVVVSLILVWLRRLILTIGDAVFDASVRQLQNPPGAWRRGCAKYSEDCLEWFPLWGIKVGPKLRLVRSGLELQDWQRTKGEVGDILEPCIIQVRSRKSNAGIWQLALSEASAMGFISWIEAAPPGRYDHYL
uniref:DUF2550 domain-containing protein n=1 Tax=Vaginimicrobium propionicum TaxID=1871034 RepID=UPI000970D345|nr:DUF2550 domain-containing protein [Vaginimicrobium propionicum]